MLMLKLLAVGFTILFSYSAALLGASCSVEPLFVRPARDGAIQEAMINALVQAERTADIAGYVFSDPELTEAVVAAHERGVEVRVIIDGAYAAPHYDSVYCLRHAGIGVSRPHGPHRFHHTFLVVDERLVIAGDLDPTAAANGQAWESAVVIRCPETAREFASEFSELWDTFDVVPAEDDPPRQVTIVAEAGIGGSIEPSGEVDVGYCGGQTFRITPSAGYEIASVWVDGLINVGAVDTYTFQFVTVDRTIRARFVRAKDACSSPRVDINTASHTELQGITHIGPHRADEIMRLSDQEPFCCIDALAKVDRLNGERIWLEEIKAEGIACVDPGTSGVDYPCTHGWEGN